LLAWILLENSCQTLPWAPTCLENVCKVFEEQEEFAKTDPTSNEACLNVLDKGYRTRIKARQIGGQECMQPQRALENQKMTALETLMSACVAVI
jgi:hypothetical protein